MTEPAALAAPVRTGRTLFAGALVAISIMGDSYLYAVLPVRYAEAGVSLVAVGWLLSVNRWVRFFTNPLAGALGARFGWGPAFAGALWLGAATTAAYGLVKGTALLLLARALWGLSWSFLRLGGMAAVLSDSPAGRRGRLMGLFGGVFRLGSAVAVVAGGFLADRIGFAVTSLLFAGASAVGAMVGTLPPALTGRWGAPAREPVLARVPEHPPLHHHWIPEGPAQWAVSLSASTLHLVTSGLVTATLGLLVRERMGTVVTVGGWLMGAASFTGLLLGSRFLIDLAVGPGMGHWADRRGRGPVLALSTALLVFGLLALSTAANPILVVICASLLFAAGTGATAILDAWAGDLAGDQPGRFLPVYNTWLDVGAAAGPVVGYTLAARYGLGTAYLGGAGALLATSVLRVWLLRRD